MTTTTSGQQAAAEGGGGWIPIDTFGVRLKLSRDHKGLTVKEAAALCGLNYATWSKWERGSRPLDLLAVVERVSTGLGVDRGWLLFGGPLARAEQNRTQWAATGGPNVYYAPFGVKPRSAYPDHRRRPAGRADVRRALPLSA